MTRFQPPTLESTAIITPDGYSRLQQEFHELKHRLRPRVVKALSAAAAEGDRSENAEYIYRKKQLREIDRRLHYLIRRFDVLKVVTSLPTDKTKIYFGAWVEIENSEEERYVYRIVGPDEWDVEKGWISVDSPLARGLLSKIISDQVIISAPAGDQCWLVLRIWYKPLS